MSGAVDQDCQHDGLDHRAQQQAPRQQLRAITGSPGQDREDDREGRQDVRPLGLGETLPSIEDGGQGRDGSDWNDQPGDRGVESVEVAVEAGKAVGSDQLWPEPGKSYSGDHGQDRRNGQDLAEIAIGERGALAGGNLTWVFDEESTSNRVGIERQSKGRDQQRQGVGVDGFARSKLAGDEQFLAQRGDSAQCQHSGQQKTGTGHTALIGHRFFPAGHSGPSTPLGGDGTVNR